jgi:two-component system sensor histidine kinase ChiS
MKKILYLCLFLIFISPSIFSQHSTMELSKLRVADGLSQNYVSSIIKDSKGFIWVGTCWGGLNRYDGYSFVVYKHNPNDTNSISSSEILPIYEDKNGILWIGTWDGLNKYSPEETGLRFKCYRYSPTIIRGDNIVSAIFEDSKGNLWIGGGSHGVFSFDRENEKFRNYKINTDVPGNIDGNISSYIKAIPDDNVAGYVCSITEDKEGILWIGTTVGLNKFDREKEIFYSYRPDPDNFENWSNSIASVHEDRSGTLWVGTGNGLYNFDKKKQRFILRFPEYPATLNPGKSIVCSIKEDNSGKLWFRTTDGLYNYDPDKRQFKIYIHSEYPQEVWWELANTLYIESEDIIWFAYPGEGINILTVKRKNFECIKLETDDPNRLIFNRTMAVYEDLEGYIWIGSPGDGLKRYDPVKKEFVFFRHNPDDPYSISTNAVWSIYQDKSGVLWFGTTAGLNKMFVTRDNSIKFRTYLHNPDNPSGIANNNIWWILEDKDDNFWLTDGSYLDRYNKENDSFIHLENDLLNPDGINNEEIYREVPGELWFGSWYGLHRIIPPFTRTSEHFIRAKKVVLYKYDPDDLHSLRHNWVNCLWYSRKYQPETLWLGTYGGGLHKMIKAKEEGTDKLIVQFKNYREADGLPSDIVFGISEDKNGYLWISTNNGLTKFNPETETFKNFDVRDGLPTNQFCCFASYQNKVGKIFFPTGNGIVAFYPDSIRDNPDIPPVVITDFRLFNKSVPVGENSPLKKPVTYTKKIELPYNKNYLGFEFAALNYVNTSKNQYKYMMEGIDKDWVDADTRRFADYPNLKHGKYTFKVIGSNNDGIWNKEGASVKIVIRPPWWKSKLAYVLYFLVLSGSLYVFIKRREIKHVRDKEILEKKVKERTTELHKANTILEEQKEEIQVTNEELFQQKEELQATLENLQQTQEQLIESKKMAALGGLVAGVAHEINTPVGITITAASGLIEETKKMADLYKENKISKAEFKDYLNSTNQSVKLILTNMERTATMIQSFKQVSVDQSTENKRSFKLKSYTEDVIRSLYPKLKNRKININLNIDEELEIDSYPGAYSQIITNLVLNSITHGFGEKNKGKIELKANNKNGELIIEYKDNGKGISKENLKKIFNPFFTTNKKVGTGLGMHIVYNLVTQKLKGSIECFSKTGQGILFNIQIPMPSPLASIRKKQ